MQLVNLTPHTVSLFTPNGVQSIPTSGRLTRVKGISQPAGDVFGVPLVRPSFEAIEGLPEPAEGVLYLVSSPHVQLAERHPRALAHRGWPEPARCRLQPGQTDPQAGPLPARRIACGAPAMSHDPFEGQMLLAYELADDPGNEHEEWVDDLADARRHLRGKADMVVWAYLYNQRGEEIADGQVLL